MTISNPYIVSVFARICMVSVSIGYSIILARYLGPTLKGALSYIQSIIAIASIVLCFGIHQAYPYFRIQNEDKSHFLNEYMNTVFFSFCIALSVSISIFFFSRFSQEIRICCLLSPIWSYTRVSGYVLLVENPNKRNLNLVVFSIAELIYVIALFIFTTPTLFYGVSAIVLVELLKVVLFTFWIPFKISIRLYNFSLIRKLAIYGFFPMIALLMTTLNYRIDILMLKNSCGITLAEVGIYSIGVSFAEKTLLLPDALKEILLSNLAKSKGPNEVAKVSRVCFVLSGCVGILILCLGKPVINLVYGADYVGAYPITCISIFGAFFMIFFKMIGQYNIVNHFQVYNIIFLLISIIINFTLNMILIPLYKTSGVAVATVIGHISCAIAFITFFHKRTNIPAKDIVFIKKNDIASLFNLIRSIIH